MEKQNFSPVSASKLYIQIYNQMLEAILSGTYRVGDRLPSEKELCAMFNVSRVPIREALCALELNGMVTTQQGSRVYIRRSAPAASGPIISAVEPQEIIRLRTLLEPEIAREAALHIDENGRRELSGIIERMREDETRGVFSPEADQDFHRFLARASGNSLFVAVMELVYDAMKEKMWELILSRTVSTQKYREQNCAEHINVAQAVLEGRADDACRFMKEHMERLHERYWSE